MRVCVFVYVCKCVCVCVCERPITDKVLSEALIKAEK